MNKITKGEVKVYYERLKREQRLRVLANLVILLPIVGIIFWLAGCSTTKTDFGGGWSWDAPVQERGIYNEYWESRPQRKWKYAETEVGQLNKRLNPYGVTAFRIDPNNPEHQRRYRRHFEQPNNFYYVPEEDI